MQWFVIWHSRLFCRGIMIYQKKEHIHFYRSQGENLTRTENWLRSELDGVSLPSRCFKRKQSVWWSNFRNTKSSTNFMWVRNSTVVLSASRLRDTPTVTLWIAYQKHVILTLTLFRLYFVIHFLITNRLSKIKSDQRPSNSGRKRGRRWRPESSISCKIDHVMNCPSLYFSSY